jgi:hypothetical protein
MGDFGVSFIGAAVGAGAATTIAGIVLTAWLDHRLTQSRERQSRASAAAEKRREESRAVADILAEWVRGSYTGESTNEDRWRLQTVYWRNILGLDRALLDVVLPRLANAPDAVTTNQVIVEARRVLLGLEQPDIEAASLNNWLPQRKQGA